MDKIACFVMLLFFSVTTGFTQSKQKEINIIPEPVSLKTGEGTFHLTNRTSLSFSGDIAKQDRAFLISFMQKTTGEDLPIMMSKSLKGDIRLVIKKTKQKQLGKEGYTLDVTPTCITINANEPNGLFYGVQTLLQLLPASIERTPQFNNEWKIPSVQIIDYPRFKWRGVMLDVSRHFFSKSYVEHLLNEIAKYKFNVFHWHLTDDQGWRIQIKGLPKLTEVGAWRVPRSGGKWDEYQGAQPGEESTYGGYYTQDDIREIVQYAKERYITIVPEIDVPGHSLAAVVSYPELSCTPDADKYHVNSGEPFMDWSNGPRPIALVDNSLCPANEKVYVFLDKVITQLAQLFPSEYIHMGGDEAPHNFWEKSPEIKSLMKKEGLENMNEVQSYFTKKVEKIVESKGRKLIGWEEIADGGLAPGAILQSWTSVDAGIKAAKLGNQVIMSPWDHGLYMDNSPIKRSYTFEPVPTGVDPKFILGGEGCLWTEETTNNIEAELNYWPRLLALSEVFWTPRERKNWNDFSNRMRAQFSRFDYSHIVYSKDIVYNPIVVPVRDSVDGRGIKIRLISELEGMNIYYSFENANPDKNSKLYEGDLLTPPRNATNIRAVCYDKLGRKMGSVVKISLYNLASRLLNN